LLYELKKIRNPRVLLPIAALGLTAWFALLGDFLSSYDSLLTHGIYGAYQTEMSARYGFTLEPEELADFDIPAKKAALVLEMDGIIADSPVFARNAVRGFAAYEAYKNRDFEDYASEEARAHGEALAEMEAVLEQRRDGMSLDEWYASPLMRYRCLLALERRYVGYDYEISEFVKFLDDRPVARASAERIRKARNASLIPYFLCGDFALYAAVTGAVAVFFTLLLVSPLVVADRQRHIHLLQYSSAAGRGVLRLQFIAIGLSALVFSLVCVCALYAPILLGRAGSFWNAPISAYDTGGTEGMQLYNLSFGQYVLLLAGISVLFCVGAACFAFVLARFSAGNITVLFIKAVPLGAAVVALTVLTLKGALTYSKTGAWNLLRGRFDLPELWLCGLLAFAGVALAAWLVHRERRVDVI
jgi:hypothetical protein